MLVFIEALRLYNWYRYLLIFILFLSSLFWHRWNYVSPAWKLQRRNNSEVFQEQNSPLPAKRKGCLLKGVYSNTCSGFERTDWQWRNGLSTHTTFAFFSNYATVSLRGLGDLFSRLIFHWNKMSCQWRPAYREPFYTELYEKWVFLEPFKWTLSHMHTIRCINE